MSQSQPSTASSTPRPRRRWWQWLLRIGLPLTAVLAGLYAALPWWAPKAWLARTISARLSRQLSLPVRIDRLELSWTRGVRLEGVWIGCPDRPDAAMVSIGLLRADLSPLRMLLDEPLEWAQLEDVTVCIVIDGQGKPNIMSLDRLQAGRPPRRVTLRNARAILELPQVDHRLELEVADLQYCSGRLNQFGRVTMSAQLKQPPPLADAPVTLLAQSGLLPSSMPARSRPPAGSATFGFAGVNLAYLGLPEVLALPLARLSGQAAGQLECQLDGSGVVERFSLDVRVRDLDAQPRNGPRLPVIDEAQVILQAAYDPLTERMDMRSLRVRLPGADLLAEGKIHADVLRGGWEGVQSLVVSGAINPTIVAALLGQHKPDDPTALAVDGDVKMNLSLAGDRVQVNCVAMLDATAAAVRAGQRVIKPVGRTLSAQFSGSLQTRTGHFAADRTELTLGGNRFQGRGTLENLRRLLAEYMQAGQQEPLDVLLRHLRKLAWEGNWEITELASLSALAGQGWLDGVVLKGPLTGNWSCRDGEFELHALRLGADAAFEVGPYFCKPAGVECQLDVAGKLDEQLPALKRVRVALGVGSGQVNLDLSAMDQPPAGAQCDVAAEGTFSIRDLAAVLAAIPPLQRRADIRLGGSAGGKLTLLARPDFRRLLLECNASNLDVSGGGWFLKPAGQPAELTLDLRTDERLSQPQRHQILAQLNLGASRLEAALSFGKDGPRRAASLSGRLNVADAGWLLERLPCLAGPLREYELAGTAWLSFTSQLDAAGLAGELTCVADDLQFRLPQSGGTKLRSTPCRLRLAGRWDGQTALVQSLSAELGKSSVWLNGKAVLVDPTKPGDLTKPVEQAKLAGPATAASTRPAHLLPPRLAELELAWRGNLAADAALRSLLPALAARLGHYAVEGVLVSQGKLSGGPKGINVSLQADATRLAAAWEQHARKPLGQPANLKAELFLPPDLQRAQVRDLYLDLQDLQVRADASIPLLSGQPFDMHFAVNCPQLARLAEHVPKLAAYRPAGSLLLDGEYARAQGKQRIKYVTFTAHDVTGRIADRPCRLEGTATLEELMPGQWAPRRFYTDSLEFVAGKSHGFLVGDVDHVNESPEGKLQLLCQTLDVHELGVMLGGEQPSSRPAMSAQELSKLGSQADRVVARMVERLACADVHLAVQAQRLVQFEQNVGSFYEVPEVVASLDVQEGRLALNVYGGLNGGQIEQKLAVNLQEQPLKAVFRGNLEKVAPHENIQRQLAQEFPGNTVEGSFSRRDELSYPLREMVMNLLDSRYRPNPTGQAVTIAEEGVVKGRAAPKWMTRVFPGLNLATYRYRRMTGFNELSPDGSTRNDMIFDGVGYDMYMEGLTNAQRTAQYEIGVILLGAPQSAEFNHRWRTGRIPILNFKARLVNGRFEGQEVWYKWPTETAAVIFLKNNIFYRLWLNARKSPKSDVIFSEQAASRPADRKTAGP